MKKLILKCGLSPGDLIMLTAALRDLHRCYPNQFATDVRTCCSELWENNPYLSPLPDDDNTVRVLDCAYPLINRCDDTPYHCVHGFIDFLNRRLGLAIKPTAFKGDIHLSAQERAWYSQVREVTRANIPFWIIAAGGKYDITIKWWSAERYQAVVDHFRGKVQFVQVGENGHRHPRLDGVIDLRGQTTLRELIRLVYHAQGVLCGVTELMHLAAAVEPRRGRWGRRPCVVGGGGPAADAGATGHSGCATAILGTVLPGFAWTWLANYRAAWILLCPKRLFGELSLTSLEAQRATFPGASSWLRSAAFTQPRATSTTSKR